MAALLRFAPAHGVLTAGTIWRMNRSIEGALRREAQARPAHVVRRAHGGPTLVCHWQQSADRRLSCDWDIEVPRASILSE
jgi:hypothetical protein